MTKQRIKFLYQLVNILETLNIDFRIPSDEMCLEDQQPVDFCSSEQLSLSQLLAIKEEMSCSDIVFKWAGCHNPYIIKYGLVYDKTINS